MSETSSYQEPSAPMAQWTDEQRLAWRDHIIDEMRRDGYILEGRKQEAIEAEAASIFDRVRGLGLKVHSPETESSSDTSSAMREIDAFIREALDLLRSYGIEKPLTPLAWALYNAPLDDKSPVDLAVAFRAADSQMLVTRFNQESEPAAKEALRQRLRARLLLRLKQEK